MIFLFDCIAKKGLDALVSFFLVCHSRFMWR